MYDPDFSHTADFHSDADSPPPVPISIRVLERASAILAESGPGLNHALISIARLLGEILGDVCSIRLLSADGKSLEPCVLYDVDPARGEGLKKLFEAGPISLDEGIIGKSIRERRVIRAHFRSKQEALEICSTRYRNEIEKHGVRSIIAAPLLCRGKLTGTLALVRSSDRSDFTESDERALRWIAECAASTIDNARLYEEAQRAKEEASTLASQLRMISDSVPVLISYIDSNLVYRFVNAMYEKIFSTTKSQIVGRHMSEVMRPDWFVVLEPKIRQALKGSAVKFESAFTLPSGEQRFMEITYVPNREGEEITGVYALASHVSKRKWAELALKRNLEETTRARAEAEAARKFAEAGNRAKDLFLATLSHELRTPLNTILSYAQMIRMGLLDQKEALKGIEMIEQSAITQAQLINDLLDVSSITMGKLVLNIREVDPVSVLRSAIESIRPQLEEKSLRIDSQFSPPGVQVFVDPVRLKQIYLNLLVNAVKFSDKGGTITVALDQVSEGSEDFLRLRVVDYGKGIRPDFLPHIFDRFSQADSSITRSHGGMGLGLAIVRALAEQHGGYAAAESQGEGQGATLSVLLPLRSARVTPGNENVGENASSFPPAQATARDSALEGRHRLDGIRIVLVDDDPPTRASLSLLLTALGATVHSASSASAGYRAVIESRPDLLVSDIAMPGEDGYSLMAKIRALAPHQCGRIPSLALTAFASPEDTQRALKAGFQAYLSKPVSAKSLGDAIQNLLGASENPPL